MGDCSGVGDNRSPWIQPRRAVHQAIALARADQHLSLHGTHGRGVRGGLERTTVAISASGIAATRTSLAGRPRALLDAAA